jgi:hypothetical protein
MLRPLSIVILRTIGVRSTIGVGTVELPSVPVPNTPYFASPIVKGIEKVAPDEKSKDTEISAGSAIVNVQFC